MSMITSETLLKVDIAFGAGILLLNLYNMPRSKIMVKTDRYRLAFKYGIISVCKGLYYGTTFPLSFLKIILNSLEGTTKFNDNFVPCSTYFNEDLD